MNTTTYRLANVVINSASTIDAILENKVYRNDVGNNWKTELRNTLNDLRCSMIDYTNGKKHAIDAHSDLSMARLKLAQSRDRIDGLQFFEDRGLLLTNTVNDSITILRQIMTVLMQQIAVREF